MTIATEQHKNATYAPREVGQEKRHRDGGIGRSVQRTIVKTPQIPMGLKYSMNTGRKNEKL